jgi:RNA polymerase sigma factor (sigma-70 family)
VELLLNPRVSWLCFLRRLLPFAGIFPAGSQENAAPRSPAETARERNRQAERLLDTYGNHILRLAYSYLHNSGDAEDVLQDTLIQFLKAEPVFESGIQEKAWLLRVAANLSKNRIRYNKVRDADQLQETLAAEERADLSFVWEAVKSLPQPYREVLHLFYYEGCSSAEISSILGIKEATVRTHLRRGRARLKDILKEAYDFDESV